MRWVTSISTFLLLVGTSSSFHVTSPLSGMRMQEDGPVTRRKAVISVLASSAALIASRADAESNNAAPGGRQSFDAVSIQVPASGNDKAILANAPFNKLASGVSYKDFRAGTGGQEVKKGNRVVVQATGRLLNLNGVKFYSTKDNIVDELAGPEPIILVIGNESVLPGLEEGIIGMRKGGIRRIIVPASLGYGAGKGQLPYPDKQLDRNALSSVLKNPRRDATLLWDVQVERIK